MRGEPVAEGDGGFRPWHLFLVASLLSAGAGMIAARGAPPAHLAFVGLAIGAAGLVAFALYAALWPLVAPTSAAGSDSLGEGMRAALVWEKASVLRAIKELEFDHAMGKVAKADFQDMSGRLRARAIRLIRQLDTEEAGYRELIERELGARRAAAEGQLRAGEVAPEAAASGPAGPSAGSEPQRAASLTCRSCGTPNDLDAQFCKQCGNRLLPSS